MVGIMSADMRERNNWAGTHLPDFLRSRIQGGMKCSEVIEALMKRKVVDGRRLNQLRLAEATGISQSTISRILRDIQEPDVETLLALARYFDVSVDKLLGLVPLDHQELSREALQIAIIADQLPSDGRRSLLQSAEEKKFFLNHRPVLEPKNHSV